MEQPFAPTEVWKKNLVAPAEIEKRKKGSTNLRNYSIDDDPIMDDDD